MHIPGMVFQDQSWNSFQKLMGDIALDYYERNGCDELIDITGWKTAWLKLRDHFLMAIEDRGAEFDRIVNRSPMHDDVKSAMVSGKDLARELVLSLGLFKRDDGVPALLKLLGSKLASAEATFTKQATKRTTSRDGDEGLKLDARGDVDEVANFLESQDADLARAQASEAKAHPRRALWRQATNWVLKELRDRVDVSRYNEAWASSMGTARDHMTVHQLTRLRQVDAYLRDVDRFVQLGDPVKDWLPAVVGPTRAKEAASLGRIPSVHKMAVSEAAECLLAYDANHDGLCAMYRERLTKVQQRAMFILHVETPLHRKGNKFTCTPESVSKLIETLRQPGRAAVGNTETLRRRFGSVTEDETGELVLPESTVVPPDRDATRIAQMMQIDRSAWTGSASAGSQPPSAELAAPISGNGKRIRPPTMARQARSAASLAREAERLILDHIDTYPLMMQAALLKHFGHGRCDVRTLEVLRQKGVFDRLGVAPDLSALDFERLGAASVDNEGQPRPMSADEFSQAFRKAQERFFEFVQTSAEQLMAVEAEPEAGQAA